mmetsp:Transcript_47424/g.115679  ORF Transcript_47424/g.115679 Transcript_47424/m.115679 type:complete len:113 (-) Transcript_47424:80-418(-)
MMVSSSTATKTMLQRYSRAALVTIKPTAVVPVATRVRSLSALAPPPPSTQEAVVRLLPVRMDSDRRTRTKNSHTTHATRTFSTVNSTSGSSDQRQQKQQQQQQQENPSVSEQ